MAQLVKRQFDVCINPGAKTARSAPYICILQSHYLPGMDTVVVAPLVRGSAERTESQTSVPVEVKGEYFLLDIAFMANMPLRALGSTVTSLLPHEDDIRRALDRLFTGF